jgi:hypothetical protein
MAALAYLPSKPLNIPSQPFSISVFMNAAPFIAPAPMPPLAPRHRAVTKTKAIAKRAFTAPKAPRKAKPTPATPTPNEQEAARLGLPSILFGFTPNERGYWQEPNLPWLTSEMYADFEKMPLDYRGFRALLCIGYMGGDNMAPRFPRGCGVQTIPVYDKANLVVGRVYTYRYWDEEAKDWAYEMGRLVKIGGNYLEVKADNNPVLSIWLLREEEHQAVWDVREVTHYASYPDLDTLPSAG